jgi:superfamily I DNA and RNA helicase
VEVVGPAGSGKSLVAVEKARRMAFDGWRTLFVCFNQPLATEVLREAEQSGEPPERRPTVSTFHRLCETMGQRAGTLPARPSPISQEWWDATLPRALDDAIDRLPDERYDAIVVDEGQDFRLSWLESLGFLLRTPADGVFWVFHDPGQALRHDDEVASLGLPDTLELFEDYRSPAPVAALAAPFYRGPLEPLSVSPGGRAPEVRAAEPGHATVELVRTTLHRLVVEEEVRPWDIVVLSGRSASASDVWRERQFGNLDLWNGAVDDAGNSLGLAADHVPAIPPDAGVVLFETVRRFKGLERPIVVLCELPDPAAGDRIDRLDQLLYTALTRATTHLVVIAPPSLAARLRP